MDSSLKQRFCGPFAAKERPCVALCKIGSYRHPPGHCSHPSSSGDLLKGIKDGKKPSSRVFDGFLMIISLYHSYLTVTWLWFGGTVVVQNSGNSTSHKSSVFFGCTGPYTLGQCLRKCLRMHTRSYA